MSPSPVAVVSAICVWMMTGGYCIHLPYPGARYASRVSRFHWSQVNGNAIQYSADDFVPVHRSVDTGLPE